MKERKIVYFTIIASLVVMILSGTFAYFTSGVSSAENALSTKAAKFEIGLDVTNEYPENSDSKLIPMNDSDVLTGYDYKCVDERGYIACNSYTITLRNAGTERQELDGTVKTTLNNIINLSYAVIDTNSNGDNYLYKSATAITSNTEQSLGNLITLEAGETKVLKLVFWITNLPNVNQNSMDAGGTYNSTITFTQVREGEVAGEYSSEITGKITTK